MQTELSGAGEVRRRGGGEGEEERGRRRGEGGEEKVVSYSVHRNGICAYMGVVLCWGG